MELVITKKAAYFLILVSFFIFLILVTNAVKINEDDSYHTLNQILNSTGNYSDVDNNSIIDFADQALNTNWENIVHKGYICGSEEFLVGYRGNAPVCRKIRMYCHPSNYGSGLCKWFFANRPQYDPNLVGPVINLTLLNESFLNGNNTDLPDDPQINLSDMKKPRAIYFTRENENTYWASIDSLDELFKLSCSGGVCNVLARRQIDRPGQIVFKNGLVYVGSDLGILYEIDPSDLANCNSEVIGENSPTVITTKGSLIVGDINFGCIKLNSTTVCDDVDGYALAMVDVNETKLFASDGEKINIFNFDELKNDIELNSSIEFTFSTNSEKYYSSIFYNKRTNNIYAILGDEVKKAKLELNGGVFSLSNEESVNSPTSEYDFVYLANPDFGDNFYIPKYNHDLEGSNIIQSFSKSTELNIYEDINISNLDYSKTSSLENSCGNYCSGLLPQYSEKGTYGARAWTYESDSQAQLGVCKFRCIAGYEFKDEVTDSGEYLYGCFPISN